MGEQGMTKEELKQEAEEYADKYGKSNFDIWDTARFAYYQSAEPREKRIAELEKVCQDLSDKFDYQVKQVMKLEKENAELNNLIMQSKKDGISPINALIIKNLGNRIEELEKEAKEKWWNEDTVSGASVTNKIYVAGYLAGAEPREKRIAELDKENDELKYKLTKAKELLRWWLSLCGFKVEKLAKDTEQFLNSEVEK